jgi:hypothetical protein
VNNHSDDKAPPIAHNIERVGTRHVVFKTMAVSHQWRLRNWYGCSLVELFFFRSEAGLLKEKCKGRLAFRCLSLAFMVGLIC